MSSLLYFRKRKGGEDDLVIRTNSQPMKQKLKSKLVQKIRGGENSRNNIDVVGNNNGRHIMEETGGVDSSSPPDISSTSIPIVGGGGGNRGGESDTSPMSVSPSNTSSGGGGMGPLDIRKALINPDWKVSCFVFWLYFVFFSPENGYYF